jgi:antitoxin (DNA-binding transcriptional repressor) of toxin-antitoxin stability system
VDRALGGDDVVITREDHAAVRLVPVDNGGATSRPIVGAAKGTVLFMADDFDAPLDDFDDYT